MEVSQASDGSPYEKRVDAKGRVLSDECVADEVPFEELPEGWAWERLAGVASIQLGKMLDKQKNEGEPVTYLGNANVQWGEFDLANIKTMRMNEADRAKFALANGDLIVCEGGVPGRCAIWTSNKTMYYQKALHRVRCDKRLLLNTYCELYIRLIVQSHIWDGCFTGTTIKHLPAQTLSSWVLPVPPLAEQRRIVERVNQLMPLVEEYGDLEDAREELDVALPGRLRKSVLQMAVQGKLVPRDPADEPASVLLERIREHRRQLVAEKKMRAPKGGESVIFRGSDGRRYEKRVDAKGRESDPTCIEDEIPFDIPDSWEWARLESIISLLSGTDLKPNQYNDRHEGIPYLTGASNFLDGSLIENRWTSEPTCVSHKGELLFTCKGTIGEMAVNAFDESHIARQIMAIIPLDEGTLPYLIIFLKSMVESIKSSAKGVIPGIERNALLDALIPVPPKPEQARISEKLASLSNLIS